MFNSEFKLNAFLQGHKTGEKAYYYYCVYLPTNENYNIKDTG